MSPSIDQDAETVRKHPDPVVRKVALDRILARFTELEEQTFARLTTRIAELEGEATSLRDQYITDGDRIAELETSNADLVHDVRQKVFWLDDAHARITELETILRGEYGE